MPFHSRDDKRIVSTWLSNVTRYGPRSERKYLRQVQTTMKCLIHESNDKTKKYTRNDLYNGTSNTTAWITVSK